MSTMAITTLAMLATVFVGNLYEMKDRPVPAWARTVLLRYAARLLGYCTRCVDAPPGFQPPSPPTPPPAPPSHDEATDHDEEEVAADDDGQSMSSWHRTAYRMATLHDANSNNGGDVYRPPSPSTSPGVRLIVRGSSAVVQATTQAARRRGRRGAIQMVRSYSKDWTNVGAVCDRLFFFLCLCLAVTTTVVLFQPLISRSASEALGSLHSA